MAGEKYPVVGVPDSGRYDHGTLSQDRYASAAIDVRGPAGVYRSLPVTLEEEVAAGGWLPGATPTGPMGSLDRLYTIGMRGEPGYDDNPLPTDPPTGRYASTPPHLDIQRGDTAGYD